MNQINNMKNTIYSLFLLLLSILPAHASGDKPTIKSPAQRAGSYYRNESRLSQTAGTRDRQYPETGTCHSFAGGKIPPVQLPVRNLPTLPGRLGTALSGKRKALLPSPKIHSTRTIYGSQEPKFWGIMGLYNEVAANWNR